jgi:hypothetical protein
MITMSTATSLGVNYTVPPNSPNSGAKNVGGAATRVAGADLLNLVQPTGNTTGVHGSTVLDLSDTDPALSAGVFAYSNNRPLGKRLVNSLATVASTALRYTANRPALMRSINKRESYKSSGVATAFRAGAYNLYTGKFNPAPTPVVETPGVDNAANVSRSNTGSLIYRTGAKLAKTQSYNSKTG